MEPILRFECGGGPAPKITSLLSGRIVLSRMDVGKRLIELINWDAEKKTHEILCATETQGSIPAKLLASKSGEYFFSHGKVMLTKYFLRWFINDTNRGIT